MPAPPSDVVFFNGDYLPRADVRVSPDDRAFLFADGVYEVARFYGGHPFRMDDHVRRLARSLAAVRIEGFQAGAFPAIARHLVRENGLEGADATCYLQVSRGAAPRRHAFPPAGTPPTVYAFAAPCASPPERWTGGVAVVLVPDQRWSRCDVKSTALLANVLANQAAQEAGAEEAVFVRDGFVTEGSHTNVAAVLDGVLATHPEGPYILPGVTRRVVLELCDELGLPFEERRFAAADLPRAEEVVLLSTTSEVLPVVAVDGRPVGEGAPGPVAQRLLEAFRARTGGGV
jgi:D-alanine transaminase